MRCRIYAMAIAFALASSVGLTAPAMSQQSKFKIAYEAPTNAKLRPIYEQLSQRKVLDELQDFLTPLRLPRDLTVRTAQCGTTNMAYKPQGPVTICYELVDTIEQFVANNTRDAALRQTVITGAFIQAALHETAHGIFDILEVPVWGREDDAADRLAALIMMQFGDDTANVVMYGTQLLFRWSNQKWTGSNFASEVSPDAQRYFNYVCIAVAANWPQFGGLVEKKIIPPHRAKQCSFEYDQIRKAFDLRIMPYIDANLLVQARSKPWLAWAAPQ
jgi:hypothetical protein